MPYLTLSPNLTIHYLDFNLISEKSIILIHGLGVNCESWFLQIEPLTTAGYRVICPDMRGFGKSGYDGSSLTIKIMAEDIQSLISTLGLGMIDVVGISMGGTIGLQYAIDNPENLNHLVLVNTFSSLRPKNPAMWGYYLLRFVLVHFVGLKTQAKAVASRIFPLPEQELYRVTFINQVSQANVSAYRKAMRTLASFNVTKDLGKITAPTLVITGAEDTTVPAAVQVDLANRIPNCKHVIIPHSGHAVSIDQALEFNKALLSFLTTKE